MSRLLNLAAMMPRVLVYFHTLVFHYRLPRPAFGTTTQRLAWS